MVLWLGHYGRKFLSFQYVQQLGKFVQGSLYDITWANRQLRKTSIRTLTPQD